MKSNRIIFTDLDGTLLAYQDYSPAAAAEALARSRRLGVPVIPCTSKTRAEVAPLVAALELEGIYVVENGAAVYLPADHPLTLEAGSAATEIEEAGPGQRRIRLGVSRGVLIEALEGIAGRLDLPLRGLSRMTIEEVAERTGLTPPAAALARQREFSEPFVIEGPPAPSEQDLLERLARLQREAREAGMEITLGDRLFHLQGAHTKGDAVRVILEIVRRARGAAVRSIGLGDAYNDREMLAAVDQPVLVRRHDGTWARIDDIPELIRTEGIGPAGWNQAVLDLLDRAEHDPVPPRRE